METTVERMALSVEQAAAYIGVKRATLYRLMGDGDIASFHVRARRLLLRSELDRFIDSRVEAEESR